MNFFKKKPGFKFRMPTAYTTLFIIIGIVAVLTWFIPSGKYSVDKAQNIIPGTYHAVTSNPQGLWDVFMAPVTGMIGNSQVSGAISISLFILIIGGFLGVVTKTGALDAGINSIVKKYEGREKIMIIILTTLFALGGSTFGMAEETIAFLPLLFPMLLMAGFDTITAVSITLIGTSIGNMASTTNPFATGVASDTLNISMGDGMVSRIILFIILLVIGLWYILRYASRVKADPKNSVVYYRRQEDISEFKMRTAMDDTPITKKQKQVNGLFITTFAILIVGLIPWTTFSKNFDFFENFVKFIKNNQILGPLLGRDITPFGQWYFGEITVLMIVMAIIIGMVYKMGETEFVDAFMQGCADFVSVALVTAVAKGIEVIMTSGNISGTVLHWGETSLANVPSGLFAFVTFLFYIPMSFLIPSTSGLAASTMGIIGPMADFTHVPKDVIVTIYQAAAGWVGMITPTSAIVMASIQLGKFDYGKWIKFILKFMVILFVVLNVYLVIISFLKV